MSRTFLPKLKSGVRPGKSTNTFVRDDDDLLVQIHKDMEVGTAYTEGRAPTPFARVWHFQRALLGQAGTEEKKRATTTFRGILAMFALRDFYHLKIEVEATAQLVASPNGSKRIPALFGVHTSCLPDPRFLFGKRMVVFSIVERGMPPTIVAGYSPLTLFFPAARSLEHSNALNAVFWYDRHERQWNDPTVSDGQTAGRLTVEAQQQIAAWLDDILSKRDRIGEGLAVFSSDRLSSASDQLLTKLLSDWRLELDVAPSRLRGSAVNRELSRSEIMDAVERSEGVAFNPPELLRRVFQPQLRGGTETDSNHQDSGTAPSDFRFHRNTIYLTVERAKDPTVRIYGNLFGSTNVAELLRMAPAEGADLGEVLDRQGEAPVRYVILDKLFTSKLGCIQRGQNTIGDQWFALKLENSSAKLDGIYLLPFSPSILRYFSPAELKVGVKLENNIGALQVTLEHAGVRGGVRKNFAIREPGQDASQDEIPDLDPSLDLRFFPKFRLDSIANVEAQLPMDEDRLYYSRVRLSPELDKLKLRWLAEGGAPLDQKMYVEGDYVRPNRDTLAIGRRAYWVLKMDVPPAAFEIEDRGLILLNLEELGHDGQYPTEWTAGLDFGTTNSCVAIDRGGGDVTEAEKLPILVTTFLQKWSSGLRGESDEGCSVLADFFFWQNTATQYLNEHEFFPTQIITSHSLAVQNFDDAGFNPRHGLAFFPNVSLAAVESPGFTDLIEGFGRFEKSGVKDRLKLNRNLKWKSEDGTPGSAQIWREVFHRHLRLQLILAAAREKAVISRLIASYPKAFLPSERMDYEKLLKEIWGNRTKVALFSESAAAAMTLQITLHHEYFLVDMGGGTTDIAVFQDEVVTEECSFKLAGGLLEEYVIQSQNLRQAIVRALSVKDPIAGAFVENGKAPEFYRTFFQGFLAQKGTDALSALQQYGKEDRATQGFFLSALVLYAGISYFCGLWLKKRRASQGGAAQEHLQWLGNGSAFVKMLSVGGEPFEKVLVHIFNKASHGAAEVLPPRTDAKTMVAKGLLKKGSQNAHDNDYQNLRIFSSLLSNSIALEGAPWSENSTLSEFYKKFDPALPLKWIGLNDGMIFRDFLDTLQNELPGGEYNRGTLVKPAILGTQDRTNWLLEFVTSNRANIEKHFNTRLKENKLRWGSSLQSEETLYVESVFVSEVAALLAQIRQTCA